MKHSCTLLAVILLASSSIVLIPSSGSLEAGEGPFSDIYITEFNAVNNSGIEDEDGDRSDWAELYNDGEVAVDVGDCFLTDDETDGTKWRFPAPTVIPPGGFLLVFCSDKDRSIAGAELHANFKLSSQSAAPRDEDLILVEPDGATIIHGYIDYPQQVGSHTYGLEMNATPLTFVQTGAAARALIPSDGTLGATWTAPDFDDDAWLPGNTGVGYEAGNGYQDLIDLDVEDEMDDTNTTCYIRVPFDLESTDFGSLTLRMKYDDGFAAYINGTLVASGNAPGALAWNSSATDDHNDGAAVVFETHPINLSGTELGLRVGTNVLAIHGLNGSVGSSDFLILPELDGVGAGTLDVSTVLFFPQATPGSANTEGFARVLPSLALDPPCGTFTGSVTVTLTPSGEFPGGEIRYTTNGSAPDLDSAFYDGTPLTINGTTHLRARMFDPATGSRGPTVGGTYHELAVTSNLDGIPAPDDFTSNLPIMVVENFGAGGIPRPGATFQTARVSVFEPDPATGRSSLSSLPDACFRIGIRRRGESSSGFAKPQYRVELRDESDDDLDYGLLGLPAEADWVFNGPWTDKALIRNSFAFELGRQIGLEAPRTRHFEMFLSTNGGVLVSSEYVGVYVLMEKIERGRDRVDIEEMGPSDDSDPEITGGYLLRFEPPGHVPDNLTPSGWTSVEILDPDPPTPQQRDYIGRYLDDFVATLGWSRGSGANNSGAIDNDPLTGYPAFIDVDSFVNLLLINELLRDQDAFVRSDYMFKDRGGKLTKGPLWDLNLITGTGCCFDNRNTSGWQHQMGYNRGSRDHAYEPDWFVPLLRDPDFRQQWVDLWGDLRRYGVLEENALFDIIDVQADPLVESALRNFAKWDTLGDGNVGFPTPVTATWEQQIDVIKSWLTQRMSWIDGQFVRSPIFNQDGGPVPQDVRLFMTSSPAGSPIYYTLDGTDPRLPGGAIDPSSDVYDGPILIAENVRAFARVRRNNQWSAPTAHTFVVTMPPLRLTEMMYNPVPPPQWSAFQDPQSYEFIEFMNTGNTTIDLAGYQLTDGVEFTFPSILLPPGEFVVVVSNQEAFEERYAQEIDDIVIAGEYIGNLENNAGEVVALHGPLVEPIHEFFYSSEWFPLAQGGGYSIGVFDPFGDPSVLGMQDAWELSSVFGGTPGYHDPTFGSPGGAQRVGDSNQDGRVDISDAVSLLFRLFTDRTIPLPCDGPSVSEGKNLEVLDFNGDARLDTSDAISILAFLFEPDHLEPSRGVRCFRLEGCPDVCAD